MVDSTVLHIKNEWYGNEHKLSDGSYIDKNGSICYIKNGGPHREDGPAIIQLSGTMIWCLYGKKHREGGPAVESANGYKAWYKNGVLHRVGGPAVVDSDGTEEWWIDGVKTASSDERNKVVEIVRFHCGERVDKEHIKAEWMKEMSTLSDGSYIDSYGDIGYIKNGKLHRNGKPAVINSDGSEEWWVNGERITEKENKVKTKVTDVYYGKGKKEVVERSAENETNKNKTNVHVKAEWYGNERSLPNGSYIESNGDICYIRNGRLHRDDGPAIIRADGTVSFYNNGHIVIKSEESRENNDPVKWCGPKRVPTYRRMRYLHELAD